MPIENRACQDLLGCLHLLPGKEKVAREGSHRPYLALAPRYVLALSVRNLSGLQEHTQAAEAWQAGAAVPAAAPRYPAPGAREPVG